MTVLASDSKLVVVKSNGPTTNQSNASSAVMTSPWRRLIGDEDFRDLCKIWFFGVPALRLITTSEIVTDNREMLCS